LEFSCGFLNLQWIHDPESKCTHFYKRSRCKSSSHSAPPEVEDRL
jgi:hypothetical protein